MNNKNVKRQRPYFYLVVCRIQYVLTIFVITSEKILHYCADDNKELYLTHTKLKKNFAEPFLQPRQKFFKTKPKTNKQVKTNNQNPSCGSQNFLIFNLPSPCYCRMFLCYKSKLTYFNIKVHFEVGKVKIPLHLYYYYNRKRFINIEINLIEIRKLKGFSNMSVEHGNEPS